MHFKKLDLNLLVALDALLSERSVSRASERLFLSQSATSGALARLRDYFHDELLTQVGRQMVLTPLGESLAQPVRKILQQINETIESKPQFNPVESERRFRFMASDYVTTILMAPFVRHVQSIAPGINFDILPHSDTPMDALERNEVDFLIIPEAYITHAHPAESLFNDSFVCVVDAENKLVGDSLSWDDYLKLGHVVVRFGRNRLPAFDEWFLTQYGYVRRIEVVTNHFNTAPHFVIGTRRVCTLHKRLAESFVPQLPLRIVQPPDGLPVLTEVLQWQKHFDQDPAMVWVRTMLQQVAKALSNDQSQTPTKPQ